MSDILKINKPSAIRIRGFTRKMPTKHRANNIVKAKEIIKKFNIMRTGHEVHAEMYFDECGNRKVKYIPYALHFECLKGGLCFYIVDGQGNGLVPLNPFDPVPYGACSAALEFLMNYHAIANKAEKKAE